jgi:hypothetical protein
MSTQSTTQGGAVEVGDTTAEKDWGFRFKGFFRAPMRLGVDNSGMLTPGKLQFHAPPVVPDGNYTRWMYTNNIPGPWAEMMFQYGNQRVMMTTTIASYNITTGGWRELQDQLGIDRAFLTLKFPEALGNLGGMAWDVGIFQNAYGGMGKYDAGQYETYLIGRTRIAGATATADMELSDDIKLVIEAGAGAKVDQQYQRYSDSNKADALTDYPTWQPYPGNKKQIGTTLLAHGHAGVVFQGILTGTLHYVGTFVRDARFNVASQGGGVPGTTPVTPDAHIQVAGFDVKLDGGYLGTGYIGFSRLWAKNAGSVADAIEVLHSQGGWQLAQNYFSDGNRKIASLGFQYTFSLASFLMRPRPFWGQAPDVTFRVYGMINHVFDTTSGGADGETIPKDGRENANMWKVKLGFEPTYSFHPMMAVALRADLVQPNMSNSGESFEVVTPKLIFRSEFVTHEMIVLQGSWYHYGKDYTDPAKVASIMPWPYGKYGTLDLRYLGDGKNSAPPDKWVIALSASMWW